MKELYLRRSIRQFKDEIVKNEDLLKLVEAGCMAPSARNQQPWEFIICDDKTIINDMSKIATGTKVLQNAPNAIVILMNNEVPLKEFAPQDLGALIENMMIAGVTLGIGSCWLGIYPRLDRIEMVRKICNVPNHLSPYAIIALGYVIDEKVFYKADREYLSKVTYNKF